MYMVSMVTYYFSMRGFGHPVFLKPHFGHPVTKILAKTLPAGVLPITTTTLRSTHSIQICYPYIRSSFTTSTLHHRCQG